jgi:UDP-3-O-[3-hydroxymyristoyl] N-acetylglucosamine deacetylase
MDTILVVDDEEKIRRTLRGVLTDEGFAVAEAPDGRRALDLIDRARPRLAIVDIWMPDVDGIELVAAMRERVPELPVIVISGHGNVETAVRVAKLGAFEFLEKPFQLESLLQTVARALGTVRTVEGPELRLTPPPPAAGTGAARAPAGPARALRRQRTIGRGIVVSGHGLHSGVRTGLILQPLPPGSGILFGDISTGDSVPALVEWVDSTGYSTTLRRGDMVARTVEHLMATLHGYGITNLLVKMQNEVPILDGSAAELCRLIESGGVVEQDAAVDEIVIDRPYAVGADAPGEKYLAIAPADDFSIDYTLEYPLPVGVQRVVFRFTGAAGFRAEVAGARTFGFVKEIAALEAAGLAGGGRLNNCILVGEDGVVNAPLRFPDEFARHKVLDIMGDFYLLGRPLRGAITARRTGHGENVALMRLLAARFGAGPGATERPRA